MQAGNKMRAAKQTFLKVEPDLGCRINQLSQNECPRASWHCDENTEYTKDDTESSRPCGLMDKALFCSRTGPWFNPCWLLLLFSLVVTTIPRTHAPHAKRRQLLKN